MQQVAAGRNLDPTRLLLESNAITDLGTQVVEAGFMIYMNEGVANSNVFNIEGVIPGPAERGETCQCEEKQG